MSVIVEQLEEALIWTEEKAESVSKLAKLLKECLGSFSGSNETPNLDGRTAASPLTSPGVSSDSDAFLHEVAQQWSHLPKESRRNLLDPIRSGSGGDEALILKGILSVLVLLASMAGPVGELGVAMGKIAANQVKTLEMLENIKGRLNEIQMQLGEQVLIDMRRGLIHLWTAANVDAEDVKNQQLVLASSVFAGLMALPPNGISQGTTGTIQNNALIALGYWGHHLTLAMQNQTRSALLIAYACVEEYPIEGIGVFPPAYFSKDYKTEIDSAQSLEYFGLKSAKLAEIGNQKAQTSQFLDKAGGVILGIGGIALGLVGRNGSTIQLGWQGIVQGFSVYDEASNRPSNPYDAITPLRQASSMKEVRERLEREVRAECSARRQLLEKVKMTDLRKIIAPV